VKPTHISFNEYESPKLLHGPTVLIFQILILFSFCSRLAALLSFILVSGVEITGA